MSTNLKDLAERTLWTFAQAFLGAIAGSGVVDSIDLAVWQSAALAGAGAVIALFTVVARQRLAELDTRQRPVRSR